MPNSHLHLLRLVNHYASIVTNTTKISLSLIKRFSYTIECNIIGLLGKFNNTAAQNLPYNSKNYITFAAEYKFWLV